MLIPTSLVHIAMATIVFELQGVRFFFLLKFWNTRVPSVWQDHVRHPAVQNNVYILWGIIAVTFSFGFNNWLLSTIDISMKLGPVAKWELYPQRFDSKMGIRFTAWSFVKHNDSQTRRQDCTDFSAVALSAGWPLGTIPNVDCLAALLAERMVMYLG